MRTIEDTFKIAEFLKPKVYNRFKLGTKEELKEMFVKAFKHYTERLTLTHTYLLMMKLLIGW